ncbi:plasma membrane proteolipid-like protein 1 [Elsinoe australis]|uniref:Plasma membrane proteolipid-like protein 1 n=1 Tax=Elsinoe australis TaxID=40998 RepID=A0A2P7Z3A6_9PEZI|nr:hypothetical protein B9Z65_5593 [Elsinoe australis]TKX26833.1 plasma membrane proteolipid-like protein 1 [Elsinoe australis]
MIATVLLIILTIFLPPVGVYCVAGCGADLLINICLTLLGYFPGHIHAFYVEYVYYKRRDNAEIGPAPGVYSANVQTGGRGYGTMPAATA